MKRFPKPFRFVPRNPQKYIGDVNNIVMRSSWEKKFAIWCDSNPSVVKWNSEGHPIKYWSKFDQKMRRYYIDFFVQMKHKDGSVKNLAIEVKPKSQTMPPEPPKRRTQKAEQRYLTELQTYQLNSDKWEAAREWCKQNNFIFVIMTEEELGIR